jgi:dihydrofolate synthase/folylpolyglutamate synthase
MRALLERLGHPERAYDALHVVGTKGKSTTTRMTAALLGAEGLSVGSYVSPHVAGWSERIQVDGADADFERAIARVRADAEAVQATQFETLTAAALLAFADAGVDVAVVEAGLGGRHDATNVLRTRVVALTNVGLEHTNVLGETREAIAAEKLAVLPRGAVAVLGEGEWESLARGYGAARVIVAPGGNEAVAVAAAEAFLGRNVDPAAARAVRLPGRLEVRGERPLELWDGAHTAGAVRYLLDRLPAREHVVVASILADKDAAMMLELLAQAGSTLVATSSTNERALAADAVAGLARPFFARVETEADPVAAVERARSLAGPGGAVLVTGSLYVLADLASAVRPRALP